MLHLSQCGMRKYTLHLVNSVLPYVCPDICSFRPITILIALIYQAQFLSSPTTCTSLCLRSPPQLTSLPIYAWQMPRLPYSWLHPCIYGKMPITPSLCPALYLSNSMQQTSLPWFGALSLYPLLNNCFYIDLVLIYVRLLSGHVVFNLEYGAERGEVEYSFPTICCRMLSQKLPCLQNIPESEETIPGGHFYYVQEYQGSENLQYIHNILKRNKLNAGIILLNVSEKITKEQYMWLDPPLYLVSTSCGKQLWQLLGTLKDPRQASLPFDNCSSSPKQTAKVVPIHGGMHMDIDTIVLYMYMYFALLCKYEMQYSSR